MELIIRTTREELQNEIDSIEEDTEAFDLEQHEVRNENIGEDMIFTCGPIYVLTDLNLILVEGIYCNHNAEDDSYEPDWSLTLIYRGNDVSEIDFNEYEYFEQDPPLTALHNYLNAIRSVATEDNE